MKGLEEIEIIDSNGNEGENEFEFVDPAAATKDNDGVDPNDKKDDEEDKNLIDLEEINAKDGDDEDEDNNVKNSSDGDPSDESGEQSSPLSSFASALHEKGILSNYDMKVFEEAEDPYDALMEMMDKEFDTRIEEYKNSLKPQEREEFEAQEKGIDLELYNNLKGDIDYLNSVEESTIKDNEDLSKRLISFDLANRGFTNEEIQEELENYESLGKIEQKALKAKESLLRDRQSKFDGLEEQARALKEAKEQEKQEELEKISKQVKEQEEIIPGIKLTDKAKDKLIDSLTKPKKVNGKLVTPVAQKQQEDPVKFDIMLHYLNMLGIFDGNFDALTKTAKSKATKEFKKSLETNTAFSGGRGGNKGGNTGGDDDWINSLKTKFS